jgi:hypothetical protein
VGHCEGDEGQKKGGGNAQADEEQVARVRSELVVLSCLAFGLEYDEVGRLARVLVARLGV